MKHADPPTVSLSPPSPPPIPAGSVTPPIRQSIEVDVHASASIVRPGDTLVVAISQRLTDAQGALIRTRLENALPGVKAVIIAGDALAVYRP